MGCLFLHNWFVDEIHVGGETQLCTNCGETKLVVTNPELAHRTDIAQMMSNMTVRFVSGDGPLPPSWDSGPHPYAIGLSCGCAFPVELEFMPPPGVELTCPVHDANFEVLIVERLDLP